MERGGWKSGWSWGQGGQSQGQEMLGEEQEEAPEGRILERRGEVKEFEDPELTSCEHLRALLILQVAPFPVHRFCFFY